DKSKDTKSSMQERRPSVITSSYSLHRTKEPKTLSPTIQTIELGSSKIETVQDLNTEGSTIETIEDMGSCLVETIEEFSSSSLLEQPSSKKARVQISVENVLDDDVLKSPESMPVEDLTIDLGIRCAVCSRSESKQIGNKLVECHECHSHFHQKCHETRISDQDANDLRLVWYCNQCSVRMREMAKTSISKSRNTDNTSNIKSSFTAATMKPLKLQSFQRLSSTDKPSFSPTTTPKSFAIPALAAAAAASSAMSTKQPLPGTSSQKTPMQTAMKRLQMVKKKAAQKNFNHQQLKLLRR
ncbi:hypothetical protein QZH41_020054, partial [Actinostola sp. cb2023]